MEKIPQTYFNKKVIAKLEVVVKVFDKLKFPVDYYLPYQQLFWGLRDYLWEIKYCIQDEIYYREVIDAGMSPL